MKDWQLVQESDECETWRLRIYNGWLVKHIHNIYNDMQLIDRYVNVCFVEDKAQDWCLKK